MAIIQERIHKEIFLFPEFDLASVQPHKGIKDLKDS